MSAGQGGRRRAALALAAAPGNRWAVISRRERIARALFRMRVDWIVRPWLSRSICVVTYHRVFEDFSAPHEFDDGVVEHTADVFEQQCHWLATHTRVLSEDELIGVLDGSKPPRGPLSMITIDDGYVDAFDVIAPRLRRLQLPAIFFVPTNAVEHGQLGWWDRIAFVIKRCELPEVRFAGEVLRPASDPAAAIALLNRQMKSRPESETADMVDALSRACEVELPSPASERSQLLTWEHLRELVRIRFAVGAHTVSHRTLDTLTDAEQKRELVESKRLLELRLNRPVKSVAFPSAGARPIALRTRSLAREAGYSISFLPNAGVGRLHRMSNHGIPRIGAPDTESALRAMVCFPWLFG